ncbi:uncharacterized protein BJ171DRAFT_54713 [Polychytrium aggregatum]|uniref:uncharacterized protein n=1 Tax=Polychytrium aggregatum TaxID=110093 RepID=UPI0022FE58A7|nr:uncharacterized protein BJ171DRAFT_54713 [Polychytrium aggregatum]KAI9205888.1 hypothetical protein BJ171DRAFT_54713 [Polychytrium aggregatum]
MATHRAGFSLSHMWQPHPRYLQACVRIEPQPRLTRLARFSIQSNSSVAMASKVLFNRVALRRAASTPVRSSHTLTVPYTHNPITPFANGVPTEQVRELNATEKNWDFWTTSDAFRGYGSSIAGLTHVPPGEVWVLSNGKAVKEGMSFLLPFVSKVQAVKNSDPVAMGVLSDGVVSKDGHAVNVYSVFHIQVTDFSKSALYVDPESNKLDSERAAAKLVVRTLEAEIPKLTVGADRQISAADSANLAEKIVAALKARSEEFGLEVLGAEIRGAFDPSEKVSDKLRALSPSLLSEDSPIDGLKADYWAELLSPPFFEKRTFGSEKIARTPATVSLEWCIPSPPDYHHFNQVRVCVPE